MIKLSYTLEQAINDAVTLWEAMSKQEIPDTEDERITLKYTTAKKLGLHGGVCCPYCKYKDWCGLGCNSCPAYGLWNGSGCNDYRSQYMIYTETGNIKPMLDLVHEVQNRYRSK